MFEYDFFEGDHFITFDIVEINDETNTALIAISNQGRITHDISQFLTIISFIRLFSGCSLI